jgi:hypothetical protein
MRKALLIIALAVLPASAALATDQPGGQKLDLSTTSGKVLPMKGTTRTDSSCAGYGPGFIKVEGTGTCVKIGGAISVETGRSIGPR